MLPNKDCDIDKFACLTSLVGVKAGCDNGECFDFYIEDLEGIDISKLSQMAGNQQSSGIQVGNDLIRSASKEMMGDIEMLLNNGYSLQSTFGDLCSTCEFITLYQAGGGVKVTNATSSVYSFITISKIEILANITGSATLVLNDGTTITEYPVNLTAGIIAPVILDYSTTAKEVSVYFSDNTIPVGQIQCLKNKGCGCGGSKNINALDTVRYSGIINNNASTAQYGFKICAAINCSTNIMVCDLLGKMPSLFGLTLLYKVGQKAYSTGKLQTDRINTFTSGNFDEKKEDMRVYYEKLYRERMHGSSKIKSISSIVNSYLKQKKDKCVICDGGQLKTAWAIG